MNPTTEIKESHKFGYEIIEALGGKSSIESKLNCKRYGYANNTFVLILDNPAADKVVIKRKPTHFTISFEKTFTDSDLLGRFESSKVVESGEFLIIDLVTGLINDFFKTDFSEGLL
ncbi:hypothetical protein LIS04_05 [Listeria phage LIS04]|nr:hypothetical protein LIS04_05 [Listeria phage LIS04]